MTSTSYDLETLTLEYEDARKRREVADDEGRSVVERQMRQILRDIARISKNERDTAS